MPDDSTTETGNAAETAAAAATVSDDQWPGIDSRYRLIIVAALRSKQLQRGATPRIEADPRKHRSTSIALEEARRGLVPFKFTDEGQRAVERRTGSREEKT